MVITNSSRDYRITCCGKKRNALRADNAPLREGTRAIRVYDQMDSCQRLFCTVLGKLWLTMDHCCVVSKKEILYLGPFGLACWLWGTVFINRGKVEESRQTVNSTAESIHLGKVISIRSYCIINTTGLSHKIRKSALTESNFRQRRLLLFPEGRRHSNTTLLPFKKGGFHVAIESQMPIQPVVVSKYYFLRSDKCKQFHSGE